MQSLERNTALNLPTGWTPLKRPKSVDERLKQRGHESEGWVRLVREVWFEISRSAEGLACLSAVAQALLTPSQP